MFKEPLAFKAKEDSVLNPNSIVQKKCKGKTLC
jgi:hypothetical protein